MNTFNEEDDDANFQSDDEIKESINKNTVVQNISSAKFIEYALISHNKAIHNEQTINPKRKPIFQNIQNPNYPLKQNRNLETVEQKIKVEKEINPLMIKSKREEINDLCSYTLVSKKKDQCFESFQTKVYCIKEQIEKFLQNVKPKSIKTIGFYGKQSIVEKLISQLFPNQSITGLFNKSLEKDEQFESIKAFQIKEYTCLYLQEGDHSFSGSYHDQEDFILQIRYLIDCCHIIVMCLDEKSIIDWQKEPPYQDFMTHVQYKKIENLSEVVVSEIKNTREEESKKIDLKILIASDQRSTVLHYQKEGSVEQMEQYKKNFIRRLSDIQEEQIKLCIDSPNYIESQQFKGCLNIILDIFKSFDIDQKIFNQQLYFLEKKYKSFQDEISVYKFDLPMKQYEYLTKTMKETSLVQQFKQNFDTNKYISFPQFLEIFNKIQENQMKEINKQKYYDGISEFFDKMISLSLREICEYLQQKRVDYVSLMINSRFQRRYDTIKQHIFNYFNKDFKQFILEKSKENQVQKLVDELLCQITHQTLIEQLQSNIKQNQIKQDIFNDFFNEINQKIQRQKLKNFFQFILYPKTILYDQQKKIMNYSFDLQLQGIIINYNINQITHYFDFDEHCSYIIGIQNQTEYSIVYRLNKKKKIVENIKQFSSKDFHFTMNTKSKQWSFFDNDKKIFLVGKVNKNYELDDGEIHDYPPSLQKSSLQSGKVLDIYMLNDFLNQIIVKVGGNKFFKANHKGQVEQYLICLKEKEVEDEPLELIAVDQLMNSESGDIYVLKGKNIIFICNKNFQIIEKIQFDTHQFNFKLFEQDSLGFLFIEFQTNPSSYKIFQIFGSQSENSLDGSELHNKLNCIEGNIILDKYIYAIKHFGPLSKNISCPSPSNLLVFTDYPKRSPITESDFADILVEYVNQSLSMNSLQLNQVCTKLKWVSSSADQVLKAFSQIQSSFATKEQLEFLLYSRIPLQLTTIQQSQFIPLIDGFFNDKVLKNNDRSLNALDQLRKMLSFGWLESIIAKSKQDVYIIGMCGKQSVGKSSQLSRMFGVRFGVAASRCTDGIWMGISKTEKYLIIIFDCEGLLSIRKSEEEEVQLLEQMTLFSNITIVLCDLEGLSLPLVKLFEQLSYVAERKNGEMYYKSTFVLLNKGISDKGDQKDIKSEIDAHFNKQINKKIVEKVFNGQRAVGFLQQFLAPTFDINLEKFKNDCLYDILAKSTIKRSGQDVLDLMKLSIAQVYLRDNTDIDIIQAEEKFNNLVIQLKNQFLQIQKSKQVSNSKIKVIFKYKHNGKDQREEEFKQIFLPGEISKTGEFIYDNEDYLEEFVTLFLTRYDEFCITDNEQFASELERFMKILIESRCEQIISIFNSHKSEKVKLRSITEVFESKLQIFLKIFKDKAQRCKKRCSSCKRTCLRNAYHSETCNCKTDHICQLQCNPCQTKQCHLFEGHLGDHFCRDGDHKCQHKCDRVLNCKRNCMQAFNHDERLGHSCGESHSCQQNCRLYTICKKICSEPAGHKEEYHTCNQDYCGQKCEFCNDTCKFPNHNHDLLLHDPLKNKGQLMKDGIYVDKHLCGNSHECKQKCQNQGICRVDYEFVEKIWRSELCEEFPYVFHKSHSRPQDCKISIPPWRTTHEQDHKCEVAEHRCNAQCPDCLAYCTNIIGHSGNHQTKSHQNKQHCVFVRNDGKEITEIKEGEAIRKYKVGESSRAETCQGACMRQGRSHIHIRKCEGGSMCAEKSNPLARHSLKKYEPFPEIDFDEFLCKGYWGSINWQAPNQTQVEPIYNKCNFGCSHPSHTENEVADHNFCELDAWHLENHQINRSLCIHPFVGGEYIGLLDVCFTIDVTGSMGPYIKQVKQFIKNRVENLSSSTKSDIKIAIVGYRDHPPQDKSFVYSILTNLQNSSIALESLSTIKPDGGGDGPEAVLDGLYESCRQIQWRDGSQRLIFHIHDYPPHGKKEYGMASSNPDWSQKGCPCGLKASDISIVLQSKQIMYYMIRCDKGNNLNSEENVFKEYFKDNFRQVLQVTDHEQLNLQIEDIIVKEIEYNKEIVVNMYGSRKKKSKL